MNIQVCNYNGIYNGFIRYAKEAGHTINGPGAPDAVMLWTDVIDPENVKRMPAPTFVLQHGITGFDHYKKKYKPVADYHLAWDAYDEWCAKSEGAKNVTIVGCPLADSDEVEPPGIPQEFFLHFPRHAPWEQSGIEYELKDAQIKAQYADLPLVVKGYKDNALEGDFIVVRTCPSDVDHWGKCLWLIKNCTDYYMIGKQTAKYLADRRSFLNFMLGNSRKILKKVEEVCLSL